MRNLAKLFKALDQTTKTNAKVDALVDYFGEVPDADKIWAIALLSHRRPPRAVKVSLLHTWAAETSDIPQWLFEESYHIVGDLAETIALLTKQERTDENKPLTHWMEFMIDLKQRDEEFKKQAVLAAWSGMDKDARFLFTKLITGGLRVGVSQKLMVKALAKYTGREENTIAHRLMGNWDPRMARFEELILRDSADDDISRPYPFYLAYALDVEPEELGDIDEWQAERKWDGIRGQLIVRKGKMFLWSRGEELVTDKYPELHILSQALPDGTVIDCEILAYKEGRPMPFAALQKRIGRKKVAKKHLTEYPVVLMAYDLLEYEEIDFREEPMHLRRTRLEEIVRACKMPGLLLSPLVEENSWEALKAQRERSRELGCEGLMLKRKSSPYQVGRKRGDWWKWKVDPYSIDAVVIYAQRGHGRRANLFTDFTFAVWDGDGLVPFAKAYSGLTDTEFEEVTRFVRRNTIERFGPVNSIKPELVFELHFEAIAKSTRHKSGIAVRFPRIHRWRRDKKIREANTLEDLKRLLAEA